MDKMKPTVKSIYNELLRRDIAVTPVPLVATGGTLLLFWYGGKLRAISGASPDLTTATAKTICDYKNATHQLAKQLNVRVPATSTDIGQAEAFLAQYKRVVVKPIDGSHGIGITTNVTTAQQLHAAIAMAKSCYSGEVLLQQQVTGNDYRVVIIDGKMVTCAERVPAQVIGDGALTVRQLITTENETNPLRGVNYEKALNKIDEAMAEAYLGDEIHSIPAKGVVATVIGVANIGAGGKAINRTHTIPKDMVEAAQHIATAAGVFVCGVDFMYDEARGTWYLIELNNSPSFGFHANLSEGAPIDLPRIFIDRLLAAYDRA